MSEGLSKTVSFKKNHRKHQVEVLVRSPPAGTVALARGGLRTPAMTASCRNQSNEIGTAELSQSQGSQTRTGIHHCSKKKNHACQYPSCNSSWAAPLESKLQFLHYSTDFKQDDS